VQFGLLFWQSIWIEKRGEARFLPLLWTCQTWEESSVLFLAVTRHPFTRKWFSREDDQGVTVFCGASAREECNEEH